MTAVDHFSSQRKSLKLSLIDAFLYSLMVGAGETYLPAYALSIGLSEVFAGILATLPLVSGAFLQLFAPQVLKKVGSAKNWVVFSAVLQASSFVPLVYFADHKAPGFWTLFLILTLYWGAGFSISPAWNYWMGHLVPENESHQFFSRRSRISQLGLMIGLIGGGVALHNHVGMGPFSSVFATLFLFAFVCRIISSVVLSRKFFRAEWFLEENLVGFKKTWEVFLKSPEKRKFFSKLFPFILSVYISAPFVTPYMLGQLKMNYGDFMIAIVALLVGKVLASFWLEKNKKPASAFQIFSWGVIGICPAPLGWIFSENLYYIIGLQILSGFAWGLYEVGLALIFFNNLRKEEKVSAITIYNLINSLGIIMGTLLGAIFLNMTKLDRDHYVMLFAMAAAFRLLTSWALVRDRSQMTTPKGKTEPFQSRVG
ncbi:MAG: MFS transporter [Bdellovibrionota bacterium]